MRSDGMSIETRPRLPPRCARVQAMCATSQDGERNPGCDRQYRWRMRCGLRSIGLAALAAVLQLAASGAANAALNYTGQTPQNVSVMYLDLPAGSKIVIVDQVSNGIVSSPGIVVSGSGSVNVPLLGLIPGQYYVLAQLSNGQWIAQTVVFYV